MLFHGAVIWLSKEEEQLTNEQLSTYRPVTRTHRGENNSFGYSPIQYLYNYSYLYRYFRVILPKS